MIAVSRDAIERSHFLPDLSKGVQRGWRCLFHNSILGDFIICQDRIETKFSLVSFIIFEVKLLLNSSKHW